MLVALCSELVQMNRTQRTQGDGMNEQGRDWIDGITVEWSSKVPMAMWGGSLGYMKWICMMYTQASKLTCVLCKRKRKCVGEKEIPGLHWRAQWRRGPNEPQPPPSITSLCYTWHSAELCASLLQLLNKGCEGGEGKININYPKYCIMKYLITIKLFIIFSLTSNYFLLDFL